MTYYHNKWGDLMVGVFTSILKIKRLNFTIGVCAWSTMVNWSNVFLYSSLEYVPRLITWPMYLGYVFNLA